PSSPLRGPSRFSHGRRKGEQSCPGTRRCRAAAGRDRQYRYLGVWGRSLMPRYTLLELPAPLTVTPDGQSTAWKARALVSRIWPERSDVQGQSAGSPAACGAGAANLRPELRQYLLCALRAHIAAVRGPLSLRG